METSQEAVTRTIRGIVILLRSMTSEFKDVSGDKAIERVAQMLENSAKKMAATSR